MTPDQAALLRAPFPPEQIGKLPRVTCQDCSKAQGKVCSKHSRKKCAECGNNITTAHLHLDYVGHAAVTDRLLQADPEWWWNFQAINSDGSPVVITSGLADPFAKVGIWIRLTVGGVTRPAFGEGKNFKEAIGDALRNGAMRFGVGLDLWSKEDLGDHDESAPAAAGASKTAAQPARGGRGADGAAAADGPAVAPADTGPYAGDPVTKALFDELLLLSKQYGSNPVTVAKSIAANRKSTEGYVTKHREWLGRQIETVKANIANKEAMAASPFQPPAGVTEKAA